MHAVNREHALTEHLSSLEDQRCVRKHKHILQDMTVIAIAAMLCGADGGVAIAAFDRAKQSWFAKFLTLPHGMRMLGLVGMAPGPRTSKPHPEHKLYTYLLRGVVVTRPNQVWSTDITYIRLAHGVCLPGRSHRLVLASRAVLAAVQHLRGGALRRLPGRRPAPP